MSLKERIREDQDKFMKEIRETLNTNNTVVTNSIKEAISSVQTGIEQKIADLSEKIEGQTSKFNGLQTSLILGSREQCSQVNLNFSGTFDPYR